MGTKAEEMALWTQDRGCLGRAADDEPLFILRAQDRFMPELVEEWARRVEIAGGPPGKVADARRLAAQATTWQVAHGCKVPD